MPKPTVVVITTGGTIGSRLDPGTGAVRALQTSRELVYMIPAINDIANVEIVPHIVVNSWNIRPPMMLDLVRLISEQLSRSNVSGVVVTHGTDTVEETGLLADLILESDKPVVFTVAMRNLSEYGADGPRNLFDAIRTAASPAATDYGSLLVANQEIHRMRYATKTNTVNPATFQSPDRGPLGFVDANGPRFLQPPAQTTQIAPAHMDAIVPVINAVSGSDRWLIDDCMSRGVNGIILEGSGAGNVPAELMPAIADAVDAGMPVILTTRVQNGFLSPTYGTGGASGGGFDLMSAGVIPSPHWRSPQTRIAVIAGIGARLSNDDIRALLAEG